MKKLIITIVLLTLATSVQAGKEYTITWEAPTEWSKLEQCTNTGDTIMPELLPLISYSVQYRAQGTVEWQSVEAKTNTIAIAMPYGQVFELRVGAKTGTKYPLCYSETIIITTPDPPSPGICGLPVVTP